MQLSHPKLNFPPANLRLRRSNGCVMVWGQLRKCYLVLTPEEWVRQHAVSFLLNHLDIPAAQIVEEYPVPINTMNQRADIVVLTRQGDPQLLVECKAADVKLSQSTLDQAVRYNSVLRARYILLTNGVTHHLYEWCGEGGSYRVLNSLSELKMFS